MFCFRITTHDELDDDGGSSSRDLTPDEISGDHTVVHSVADRDDVEPAAPQNAADELNLLNELRKLKEENTQLRNNIETLQKQKAAYLEKTTQTPPQIPTHFSSYLRTAESQKLVNEIRRPLGYGVALDKQAKLIIKNLFQYFKKEKDKRQFIHSPLNVYDRLSAATGISNRTLRRECGRNAYKIVTNFKKRGRKPLKLIDSFDMSNIRRIVHSFIDNKKVVTVEMLLNELRTEINFPYGKVTLWKILKKLGFKYKRIDKRIHVYNNPNITARRRRYLDAIRRFRNEGRPVFYQDETWCNQGHTLSKGWCDTAVEKCPTLALQPGSGLSLGYNFPIGLGKRLIISHVGGDNGFVEGVADVFRAKNSGDYHESMNSSHFENWFEKKLMPALPPNSVIVIDNAPYHSRKKTTPPSSASSKSDMIAWLKNNNINFDENQTKQSLYTDVIIPNKVNITAIYVIDEIAKQFGHSVLRLPPYHCDLDPIELIWGLVKRRVAKRNTTFKLADVESLVNEELLNVSHDEWKNSIKHVAKIEDTYRSMDGCISSSIADKVKPVIIPLDDSDTSDSDEL